MNQGFRGYKGIHKTSSLIPPRPKLPRFQSMASTRSLSRRNDRRTLAKTFMALLGCAVIFLASGCENPRLHQYSGPGD